jgi:tetratricopeptide (TPR) repeat protein
MLAIMHLLRGTRFRVRAATNLAAIAIVLAFTGCSTTGDKAGDSSPAQVEIDRREAEAAAHPQDARAQYLLGNAYFDAGRYADARVAYERSVVLDPNTADTYTNLGLTQRVLGDAPAAIENYRRALALAPDDVVTLQNLTVALQSERRTSEAVDPLSRLAALKPDDVALLSDYAATLDALERFDEAASVYRAIVKLRPDDLRIHYALGRCYFELGRWNDAVGAWSTVVAFDRDFSTAHSGLAAAYFEMGDYDRAWDSVRECQRLGAYIDPTLVTRLQEVTGKLGPE